MLCDEYHVARKLRIDVCRGAISKATSHSRFKNESIRNITLLLSACSLNRRYKDTANGILQNVSRIHIIIRGTVQGHSIIFAIIINLVIVSCCRSSG